MNSTDRKWKEAIIAPDDMLRDAIQCLNNTALQIVLIVDGKGKLLGTVTDGDIRRALLQDKGLEVPVRLIMNQNPIVVSPDLAKKDVLQLMAINTVHQIPIVDLERNVVGLHLWNMMSTRFKRRQNTMIVMAGGFGKRLRPHTDNCPKPMLKINGQPILEHILLNAISHGFSNFIFSLHYLGDVIKDYFENGSRWGVKVEYIEEANPLGTAGALSLINKPFEYPLVVINGDVVTKVNYGDLLDFHIQSDASITMGVRQFELKHPFGVVETEGINVIRLKEKPSFRSNVNAGMYVIEPSSLGYLEKNQYTDMPELLEKVLASGRNVVAYSIHEDWVDIGRPNDLDLIRKQGEVSGA